MQAQWVFSEILGNLLEHGLLDFGSELGGKYAHEYNKLAVADLITSKHKTAKDTNRHIRMSYRFEENKVVFETWQSDAWPSFDDNIKKATVSKNEDSGIRHGNGLFMAMTMIKAAGGKHPVKKETGVVEWEVSVPGLTVINDDVDQDLLEKIIQSLRD